MNKLSIAITLALFFTVSFAIDNCATTVAGDATKCAVCTTGYGVIFDKSGCTQCTLANCAKCDQVAANGAYTCTTCVDGQGLKAAACTKCTTSNCATCGADADTCSTCKDGYAKVDGKTCTACTNNCKTCQSDPDAPCDACPTGFVTPNKTTAGAEFCCNSKDCVECSSGAKCTKCSGSIKLDEDKGTCFGFKTGASLTLGAIVSVALFSLLF